MTDLTKPASDDLASLAEAIEPTIISIDKLPETIKPTIIGIMNDDEDNNKFHSAFHCPVSSYNYDIVMRDAVDIDEDTPEAYRVDTSNDRGPLASNYVLTIEDAYEFIAQKVAKNVVNARQTLVSGLAELNLAL